MSLVGTDPERIVREVKRCAGAPRPAVRSVPYGDGRAGERIAAIVTDWLAAHSWGGREPIRNQGNDANKELPLRPALI